MTTDMLPAFVQKLVPPAPDRTIVANRRREIAGALTNSGVNVIVISESGSFSHGTGIPAKSDVDVMVWTGHEQKPTLPSSALTRFKNALDKLSTPSIGVHSPVVQIEFWSGPSFEVVPAFYSREVSGHQVFSIAGRRDEWVESAPSAHNAFVNRQNDRLSKKVKPLIRLVKAWKYHVGVPASSFYLEMRVAEYARGEQAIVYDIDLRSVFRRLISVELRDMNDPEGIVARIPATSSEANRLTGLAAARRALTSLESAEQARLAGRSADYWFKMTEVFGNDFPWPT